MACATLLRAVTLHRRRELTLLATGLQFATYDTSMTLPCLTRAALGHSAERAALVMVVGVGVNINPLSSRTGDPSEVGEAAIESCQRKAL